MRHFLRHQFVYLFRFCIKSLKKRDLFLQFVPIWQIFAFSALSFLGYFFVFTTVIGCSKENEFSAPKNVEVVPATTPKAESDSKQDSPQDSPKVEVAPSINVDNVKLQIIGEPEPQKYSIHLSWPKIEGNIRVTLGYSFFVTNARDAEIIIPVTDNMKADLLFEYIDKQGRVALQKVHPIIIPKDFVIRTAIVEVPSNPLFAERVFLEKEGAMLFLDKDVTINTNFFFLREGSIAIYDRNFTINTNFLFARGGIIETFPDDILNNSAEELDLKSSDGGKITINAKNASGDLSVYLRGLSGKQGERGPFIPRLPPATKGQDATYKLVQITSSRCRASEDSSNCFEERCDKAPTNGSNGSAGSRGKQGQPGFRGGATGDLTITIEKNNGFSVMPYLIPGKGGKGGLGEAPQQGQPGGPPGEDPKGLCPKASAGANGADGPTYGAEGEQGPTGAFGNVILNIPAVAPAEKDPVSKNPSVVDLHGAGL